MNFTLKQPESNEEFKQYYHLRWKILRSPWNQPEGTEIDTIEDQCFHLIAVDSCKKVVGVSRLQFNSDSEAQIRYMAVAKEFERRNIGRALIKEMEQHARLSMRKNILLNARESAIPFYKNVGYKVHSKSYLLYGTIQHYRMFKSLGL